MNNTEFSQEDYKNIAALIAIAPITGKQAMTVAVLQQKLVRAMEGSQKPQNAQGSTQEPEKEEDTKDE